MLFQCNHHDVAHSYRHYQHAQSSHTTKDHPSRPGSPHETFNNFIEETAAEWDEESDDDDNDDEFDRQQRPSSNSASGGQRNEKAATPDEKRRSGGPSRTSHGGVKTEISGLIRGWHNATKLICRGALIDIPCYTDPTNSIRKITIRSSPAEIEQRNEAEILRINAYVTRFNKFKDVLESPNVDQGRIVESFHLPLAS
jgi:hypothetical protein